MLRINIKGTEFLLTAATGAVFYVEHDRHLSPHDGEGDKEETSLVRAMGPFVYSLAAHGLSIPALDIFYHYTGKSPIQYDAIEMRRLSMQVATPPKAIAGGKDALLRTIASVVISTPAPLACYPIGLLIVSMMMMILARDRSTVWQSFKRGIFNSLSVH
ncbi:uncharacterized protein FPRN_06291 [Fusarium proliferatum]|nr:uncharacterized protein FPRN_06291 [Fusarium proliferatum]